MNIERQTQIDQLIEQTFNSIIKLRDTLTEADYEWADQNCEENDTALAISGLGENIKDWGKEFRS